MPADEYYETGPSEPIGDVGPLGGSGPIGGPGPAGTGAGGPGAAGAGPAWMDRDAGPIVRPYAMTGGRARSDAAGFDLVSFVVATGRPGTINLLPEHRALVAGAGEPISVAELASHVDLPLGVVRVLLGDLLTDGLISMYSSGPGSQRPDERVLKAVINGLRSL
jgi:hypothetical protein